MNALDRIAGISKSSPMHGWTKDDFIRAAARGKHRWQETEAHFEIEYSMFDDAVGLIEPGFRLSAEDETKARSADVSQMRNLNSRIAVWFIKWERCPSTSGLANPYEPWIEIWEHGGAFSVEHGQFVDVFDQHHMPVGAVIVRRA